jgi:hypothetical protein
VSRSQTCFFFFATLRIAFMLVFHLPIRATLPFIWFNHSNNVRWREGLRYTSFTLYFCRPTCPPVTSPKVQHLSSEIHSRNICYFYEHSYFDTFHVRNYIVSFHFKSARDILWIRDPRILFCMQVFGKNYVIDRNFHQACISNCWTDRETTENNLIEQSLWEANSFSDIQ